MDLLFCYKLVFGLLRIGFDEYFKESKLTVTRGHRYRLCGEHCLNGSRRNFFINRVLNCWNSLPETTDFNSLNAFRRDIGLLDLSKYLKGTIH